MDYVKDHATVCFIYVDDDDDNFESPTVDSWSVIEEPVVRNM